MAKTTKKTTQYTLVALLLIATAAIVYMFYKNRQKDDNATVGKTIGANASLTLNPAVSPRPATAPIVNTNGQRLQNGLRYLYRAS